MEEFPPNLELSVDTQRIRIADDGQSVFIVEQLKLDLISPHISLRWTYQLVKSGDNWVMDYSNLALIPVNEDLPKINAAYEEGS